MLWTGTILSQPKSVWAQFRINEALRITASDPGHSDRFGGAVAISGDVVVVGAALEDQGGTDSGSVYIYRFNGRGWTEEAKLTPSDPMPMGSFGYSVSVDGDVVLVGNHPGLPPYSGAAYVFRFDGARWYEESKLVPANPLQNDEFGSSVSVSGKLALIGASGSGVAGRAYVFHFDGDGWTEGTKLAASDGVAGDGFGMSVSASGNTCVVGASNAWSRPGIPGGAAYVYHFDGADWVEEAKLTAFDAVGSDNFGYAVSIDDDVALVGAPGKPDVVSDSGAAYIFRYRGGWVSEGKLVPSDVNGGDNFAQSVSVDGDSALMGSPGDDDQGDYSGSAYLYRYTGDKWTEEIKFTASDGAHNESFGNSVCLGSGLGIVGAHYDTTDVQAAGSVYVFGTRIADSDPPCGAIDARQP